MPNSVKWLSNYLETLSFCNGQTPNTEGIHRQEENVPNTNNPFPCRSPDHVPKQIISFYAGTSMYNKVLIKHDNLLPFIAELSSINEKT